MPGIDLLLLALYLLIGIFLVWLLDESRKWQGLLFTSLLFLAALLGIQLIFYVGLGALVYLLSFRQRDSVSWGPVSVLLLLMPLLLVKTMGAGSVSIANWSQVTESIFDNGNWFRLIGISYFTFNAVSYLVDVRRGYLEPEPNIGRLLLYLLYLPAFFSGPLHRAKYLFAQFAKIRIGADTLSAGFRLMLFGCFKQLVLAQRCKLLLTGLLKSAVSGWYYLLAGGLFFLYLYLNFSSFLDVLQGVSKMFNITLRSNFRNRIYLAHSRQHFWSGWHITLNEWFRDYFFFPLAKRDRSRRFTELILLATFVLIAMWHQVSLVFLLWGSLNASWIILEKKIDLQKLPWPRARRMAGVVYHLSIASLLALVFISNHLQALIDRLFKTQSRFPQEFMVQNRTNIAVIAATFLLLDQLYRAMGSRGFDEFLGTKSTTFRWATYLFIALLILVFGMMDRIENYYTQF